MTEIIPHWKIKIMEIIGDGLDYSDVEDVVEELLLSERQDIVAKVESLKRESKFSNDRPHGTENFIYNKAIDNIIEDLKK